MVRLAREQRINFGDARILLEKRKLCTLLSILVKYFNVFDVLCEMEVERKQLS